MECELYPNMIDVVIRLLHEEKHTYAMLCDDKDREQSYTTANQETPKIAGK